MKFLGRFSRITTAGRTYIPQLDGLRFAAVMSVIAFHVQAIYTYHLGVTSLNDTPDMDWVSRLFEAGCHGVALFFTISGFVLAIPFAREKLRGGPKLSPGAYYLRRVTRLEPPYIIHLMFVFILSWAVLRYQPTRPELYQNPAWASYTLRHLLPSLFYSHGFVFGTYPFPNIVLWSLEIEVQFYLIAPLLAAVFRVESRRRRRLLLIGLMLLTSLVGLFAPKELVSRIMLLDNLHYFLGGFLLADIYLTDSLQTPTQPGRTSFLWDIVFALTVAGVVVVHYFPSLTLAMSWLMFACCLATFKGWFSSRFFGNAWVTAIGGMCYTIYMYHWLMISGVVRFTRGIQTHVIWLDMLVEFIIVSAIIIPVCALIFLWFERPFMQRDWPSKLWATIRRKKS